MRSDLRSVLATAGIFIGTAALLAPRPALAQAGPAGDGDLNRQLEQLRRQTRLLATPDLAAGDRALIDYGASLTESFFSVDTSAGDTRSLWQTDLNLFARVNLDGAHEFFVRDRIQYRGYNTGDETATDDDGTQNFLEEAYYKFDLARYLAAYRGESTANDLTVTVGRQFVNWESGLVLSQYLDAVRAQSVLGAFEASLLAGVTTYGTTDFDTSRPYYDKSTYRGFFGGEVALQLGAHRPYAYYLAQRDYNKNRTLDLPGTTAEYEYNSNYLGIGSAGALGDHLRYAVEGVYEFGSGLSSPFVVGFGSDQTKQNIDAWAGLAQVEYLFNDPRKSRVGETFIIASGDRDRADSSTTVGGNATGTRDTAFNGLGIVTAGYAFAPQLSNIMVLRTNASFFPFATTSGPLSRLQLGSDLLFFAKTTARGNIDESTTAGERFLGTELDVYANWRVLEDVTFSVRYGLFFPGSALDTDRTRQFLYTSLTYSF